MEDKRVDRKTVAVRTKNKAEGKSGEDLEMTAYTRRQFFDAFRPRQKHGHPEYDIQCCIVRWMANEFPGILFTISLGGVRLPMGLAVKAKKAGYQKGTPDIQIFEPRGKYHGLFVEVKTDKGKPDEEGNQERYIDELNKRGYCATFGYGEKEIKKIIKIYMGLKNERI